jgi:N-acetylglucosaminyl-diphospho-decaprenol L-rhamnosyltransferase
MPESDHAVAPPAKPTEGNPWAFVDNPLLKLGEEGTPRSASAREDSRRRWLVDDRLVDLSVCIVNWNCRDLLRQCLTSLLDYPQHVRIEVIVVDNASSDGAADMVEQEFPEVLLIRNETNAGFARANNQGARRARGRYIAFLNNDTAVPPGTLHKLVDYLEAHAEVSMVGPRLRGADGRVQVSWRPRPTLATFLHKTVLFRWLGIWRRPYHAYRRSLFDPDTTRAVDVLMGAAILMRRDRFLDCGGWDEDFVFGGEDLELCYRVQKEGLVVFCADAEIIHYGRVSTRAHSHFAAPHIAVGFVKYLRRTGASRPLLWLYKVAVTLDAPVQIATKGIQCLWRAMRGHKRRAEQSRLACGAAANFLVRGLIPFWKA